MRFSGRESPPRRGRSRSPPPRIGGGGRRSFSPMNMNDDHYSGITALENLRDRGISPTRFSRDRDLGFDHRPLSPLRDRDHRGHLREREREGKPHLMVALRVITALEDLLGSLAPQIDVIMSRAIALESKQDGTSNMLLEDPDIAAILQMTKEKLSGQIMAGLLERQKENAVRTCVDKLNVLLQVKNNVYSFTYFTNNRCLE